MQVGRDMKRTKWLYIISRELKKSIGGQEKTLFGRVKKSYGGCAMLKSRYDSLDTSRATHTNTIMEELNSVLRQLRKSGF